MRRPGLLRQLMERQEDVKERLQEIRTDLREVGSLQSLTRGYQDDPIVAIVIARSEMKPKTDDEDPNLVEDIDLVWAVEFLDHLDTQGFEIRRKRS